MSPWVLLGEIPGGRYERAQLAMRTTDGVPGHEQVQPGLRVAGLRWLGALGQQPWVYEQPCLHR